MKYNLVLSLWTMSFIIMTMSADIYSVWFWSALIVFGLLSCYITKHAKRLTREIDRDFGKMK